MANLQSIGKSGWPIRSGPRANADRRDGRGGGRGRGTARKRWGDNGFDAWGGYMSAKKAKLADQFNAGKQGSDETLKQKGMFHGVSIYVNGWTDPSADELKRIMMVHDGNYHHYYSITRTTHIVATNLPYAKIKELKGEKVVHPTWITESVAAGKLLDWQKYQLYRNLGQKNKLNFAKVTNGSSVSLRSEEERKEEVEQEPVTAVDDYDEVVPPSDDEFDGPTDGDDDLFAGEELPGGEDEWNGFVEDPSSRASGGTVNEEFLVQNHGLAKAEPASDEARTVENGPILAEMDIPVVKPEPVSISSIQTEDAAVRHDPVSPVKIYGDPERNDAWDPPSPGSVVARNEPARVDNNVPVAVKLEPVSMSSMLAETTVPQDAPAGSGEKSEIPQGKDPWGSQFDDDDEFANFNFDELEAGARTEKNLKSEASDIPLPPSNPPKALPVVSIKDEIPVAETERTSDVPAPTRTKEKPAGKKDDASDGRRMPKPILSEFYGRSRLHHISTMGTFFKDYVAELHATGDKSFPGLQEFQRTLPSTSTGRMKPVGDSSKKRVVMHIDMDCFFVSVGLRKHPELRGKPVAVTHSRATGGVRPRGQKIEYEAQLRDERREARDAKRKGRGDGQRNDGDGGSDGEEAETVGPRRPLLDDRSSTSEVSSCSYEARAKGVRNGMYLGAAVKLCPDLVPIMYDFEGYTEVSKLLYDTVARYTHSIEAVSCDEMFVDLTDVLRVTGASPLEFLSHLRKEIFEKTQCPASAGLGPNMLIARLATRLAKPNGQHFVPSTEACDFMLGQKVGDLPGVGWATSHRVEEKFRVSTCGELQQIPLSALKAEFGPKTGEKLYNFCRGVDDRLLTTVQTRKSVSAAMNYAIRFTTHKEAEDFIRALSVELAGRMERLAVKCSNLALKLEVRAAGAPIEPVKFMGTGVCDSLSRQTHLQQPSRDSDVIAREALKLYSALNVVPSDLRGLGLQATKLEGAAANVQSRVGMDVANQPKMSDFLRTKQPTTAPSAPAKKVPEPNQSNVPDVLASPVRSRPATAVASTPSPRTSNFTSSPKAVAFYEKLMNPLSPARMKSSPKNSPKRNVHKSPKRGGGSRRGRPRALAVDDNRQKDIRSAFGINKQNGRSSTYSGTMLESAPRRPASINGLREVEDVKVLLKQWVEHCGEETPTRDDVERFASFLADLCRERDLVAVDALLKYFRRLLCDSRGSPAMKEAYLDLALCVSQETVVSHGAPLFYRTDFD